MQRQINEKRKEVMESSSSSSSSPGAVFESPLFGTGELFGRRWEGVVGGGGGGGIFFYSLFLDYRRGTPSPDLLCAAGTHLEPTLEAETEHLVCMVSNHCATA